jgi:hypothetical protein
MLHRRCQRAESGNGDAMNHEATDVARMLHRRCQRAAAGQGKAMGCQGYGINANAASQMSTRWDRASQ